MKRCSILLCATFALACAPGDDVPPSEQTGETNGSIAESEVTRTAVKCAAPKPTVQGVADSAGGWLGAASDHVRLRYPAGAFAHGTSLTLRAHPQNHGVRLAQEPNDTTLMAELWFRLQLSDCQYAGGPYYFLHDSTETPVDSVEVDGGWWATGEIPLSVLRIQQDTSVAQRPTGFVILSN